MQGSQIKALCLAKLMLVELVPRSCPGKVSTVLGSQELPSKEFLNSAFNSQTNFAELLYLGKVTLQVTLVLRLL